MVTSKSTDIGYIERNYKKLETTRCLGIHRKSTALNYSLPKCLDLDSIFLLVYFAIIVRVGHVLKHVLKYGNKKRF